MTDSFLRMAFQDYDGDSQSTGIRVEAAPDGAGYDAWRIKLVGLSVAVALWSAGRQARHEHVIVEADNGIGTAASIVAQKTTQLMLVIEDTVTSQRYRERVPMANLIMADDGDGDKAFVRTGQNANSLTEINKNHAEWATLKTAYDAIGRSPDGNPAVLVQAYIEE